MGFFLLLEKNFLADCSTKMYDAAATGMVSASVTTRTGKKYPLNGLIPRMGNVKPSMGRCQRKIP